MADKKDFLEEIATLPTTNLRIFVSIALAILFVIVVLVGVIAHYVTGESMEPLWMLSAFLLAMMGLDVTQYVFKRKTFDPATLGLKREDNDPPPPAPAATIAAQTGESPSGAVPVSPRVDPAASGQSEPRKPAQRDE